MTSLTWLSRSRSRGRHWSSSRNRIIPSSKAAILKFFLNSVQFFGHVFDLSPQVGQLTGVVEDLWDQSCVIEKFVHLVFIWSCLRKIDKRNLNNKLYYPTPSIIVEISKIVKYVCNNNQRVNFKPNSRARTSCCPANAFGENQKLASGL